MLSLYFGFGCFMNSKHLSNILLFASQMNYTQAKVDSGSIKAGPYRLRYRIEGTGPTALVIGNSVYYPRIFSQDLRKNLRLVFLDHRGFAPPPTRQVDTSDFQLDTILEDIERARKSLKLGRIAVIGHSGHAYIALEYAKKYPQNVSHVIMIGIGPSMGQTSSNAAEQYWRDSASVERKAILEENLRKIPDSLLAKLSPGEQFIRNYVRGGPLCWYNPHFDSSPLWEGSNVNTDVMSYVWGQVFPQLDIMKGLDKLDQPILLAIGKYDFFCPPPSSWNSMCAKFKNITIHVYDQSAHTPQYEQAALFDKDLLFWMEKYH
jgi:proline iminopeptidase